MPQKLVRAMPKPIERLPEWAKCCPEAIAAHLACGEFVVDLATVSRTKEYELHCNWCDKAIAEALVIVYDTDGLFNEMDCLDLDEGEIPAEQPRETAVAG